MSVNYQGTILHLYILYSALTPLISELSLESNTWELLGVLYSDRLEEAMDSQEVRAISHTTLVSANDIYNTSLQMYGRSHKEIADEFFTQDSTVRQAQVRVHTHTPTHTHTHTPTHLVSGGLAGEECYG